MIHPGEKVAWRKSVGMDMDVEEEVESRKKLDEQKRKLQKELREIEKFSCLSREVQESLESNLQQQLQEVEQKRHDLMQGTRKCRRYHKRYKAFRIKEERCKKKVLQHKRRCGRSERKIDRKEERFPQLSDKVDKYIMVDAAMAAELQGLQAGEE